MLTTILVIVALSVFGLLLLGVVLFLIATAVVSLETQFWWAGWSRRSGVDLLPASALTPVGESTREPNSYVVYVSGAGAMDPARLDEKEVNFLALLRAKLPDSVVVSDFYPYSPSNDPMTGARRLRRVWEYVWRARKVRHRDFFQWLGVHAGQFRNTLHVGVSGDRRWGPLFSYGVAQTIVARLHQHGYRRGTATPLILMAISAGGQVSMGCVPMLRRMLRCRIWLVSIGSVLTDDPGIAEVEHVYHLSGSLDTTQHLGKILFSGCWPIVPGSVYNRARREGKLTVIPVGAMKHMKRGDYMSRSVKLPNGQSHVEKVLDVVAGLVAQIEVDAATRAQAVGGHMPGEVPAREPMAVPLLQPLADGGTVHD